MKITNYLLKKTFDQYDIELHQSGYDTFAVVYGKQISVQLDYPKACYVLGESLMHAMTCEGRLDTDNL